MLAGGKIASFSLIKIIVFYSLSFVDFIPNADSTAGELAEDPDEDEQQRQHIYT